MIFSSLVFVFLFLPVTVISYYALGKRFQNSLLFAASLFFYAWGEPIYVLLMLLSISTNFGFGRLLGCTDQRKTVFIAGVVFNVGFLCIFKYTGMILETVASLTGIKLMMQPPALPLGISFYTFQAMSYLIDVYRYKVPIQKSFLRFGLYIAMFAQLVAGPIVNYECIERQLTERKFDEKQFSEGMQRFLAGLGKKVILANNLGLLWTSVKSIPAAELSSLTAWFGLTAFTLQIYFDFSGYSEMAIGLGKLFGFEFPENFRYPYLSASVSEFWRRWHISLGAWFRNYVYIPLDGSRGGMFKLMRNLMAVWLLTGLWHGASWNFALWGLYHGILIMIEKLLMENIVKTKFCTRLTKRDITNIENTSKFADVEMRAVPTMQRWTTVLCHIYTILAIMIGWGIFEYSSLTECMLFLFSLFSFTKTGASVPCRNFSQSC